MTPDLQLAAELPGSLAHAWNSPMPGLAVILHLLMDAHAVIANAEPHVAVIVGDFDLDLRRMGMLEGVCQCLSPNQVGLIGDSWVEGVLGSNNSKTERAAVLLPGFLAKCGQRLWQFVAGFLLLAQVANAFPPFDDYLVGTIEHALHHIVCRVLFRDSLHHRLKTQHEALKALQKRVVQLACDTLPLFHPRATSRC